MLPEQSLPTFSHCCFLGQVNHPVDHIKSPKGHWEQDPGILVNFAGSTHTSRGGLGAWRLLYLQFVPHHLDALQLGPQQMLQRRGGGVLLARRPRHYIWCGSCSLGRTLHQLGRGGGYTKQALRFGAGAGEGGGAAIGTSG